MWECVLCGFRYDESLGDPDGGVAPGTRWEDVPDDWMCPECGARKSEFDMIVVG
nr:rubredoxin [Microvirga ossetica]